jgi:hypothetical protein
MQAKASASKARMNVRATFAKTREKELEPLNATLMLLNATMKIFAQTLLEIR